MPDQITAWIRTVWPAFVGYLAGLLITWAAEKVGIEVDSNVAFGLVTTAIIGVVYGLGRWLEARDSAFAKRVGHWLVSLGMDLGQPSYKPTTTTRPLAGAPPPTRR